MHNGSRQPMKKHNTSVGVEMSNDLRSSTRIHAAQTLSARCSLLAFARYDRREKIAAGNRCSGVVGRGRPRPRRPIVYRRGRYLHSLLQRTHSGTVIVRPQKRKTTPTYESIMFEKCTHACRPHKNYPLPTFISFRSC